MNKPAKVIRKQKRAGALLKPGWWAAVAALAFVLAAVCSSADFEEQKVSKPGQYAGYSSPVYPKEVRTSRYITVRDNTQLAADIFFPATEAGAAATEPLPVVWSLDRYHRADVKNGRLFSQLDETPWLKTLLQYGYVVAVVDVRGGGASFGKRQNELGEDDARDAYDVTEWLAKQPWSNGRIGMYGRSYLGIAQYLAAGAAPPHLVAIFPEMAMFDLYSFLYPGGIFLQDFASKWDTLLKDLDVSRVGAGVEGSDPSALEKAVEQHRANRSILDSVSSMTMRDSPDSRTRTRPYIERSPSAQLDAINRSGVAVYHLSGWYDLWPKDALLWFNNLKRPQKIVIGPWSHSQGAGRELAAEHLRWYDYWLKGIDNGVMKEPPICYYTMGAPLDRAWRMASSWPLPEQKLTPYYFLAGRSGTATSINDGGLGPNAPAEDAGKDDYTVDLSATTGKSSRWANGYGAEYSYSNMSANDARGLTYTTEVLAADVEITGHPVIRLWLSADSKDADLFAYLEEVDQYGYSRYVTEGSQKASHKKTSPAPYNNLGLPYHRSFAEDKTDLTGNEPCEVEFDLLPTSNLFRKGSRIRVTITGADKDNFRTIEQAPAPKLTLFRDSRRTSRIILPIIETKNGEALPEIGQAPAEGRARGWGLISIIVSGLALAGTLAIIFFKLRGRES